METKLDETLISDIAQQKTKADPYRFEKGMAVFVFVVGVIVWLAVLTRITAKGSELDDIESKISAVNNQLDAAKMHLESQIQSLASGTASQIQQLQSAISNCHCTALSPLELENALRVIDSYMRRSEKMDPNSIGHGESESALSSNKGASQTAALATPT